MEEAGMSLMSVIGKITDEVIQEVITEVSEEETITESTILNIAECLIMEYIHGILFERHYQRNNGTGNHKANVSIQVK